MTIWDQWANIPGWDQVKASQAYLAATPSFQAKVHDILFKYGVDPGNQADMAGSSIDFNNDPYSVVNMLKTGQTNANHATINAANDAGLGESGAAISGLNANNEDYKKNYAGALSSESSELSGALGDYTTLVGGMFDTAEQNPVTQPPAAPPAGTYSGAPSPGPAPSSYMPPDDLGGAKGAAAGRSGGTVAQKLKPKIVKGNHGVMI